jgi:hypothetical protein
MVLTEMRCESVDVTVAVKKASVRVEIIVVVQHPGEIYSAAK